MQATRLFTANVLLLGLAAGITLALIAAGAFDPQPVGPQTAVDTLAPLPVAAKERILVWQERPLPIGNVSVRLTAALAEGETDVLYGVALGGPDAFVAAAVSPLGYVTIVQQTRDAASATLLPLQPWPHVRGGTAVNEVWLDLTDNQLSVRVNRELLWSGPASISRRRTALFAQSYGETAVIDFRTLEQFAAAE